MPTKRDRSLWEEFYDLDADNEDAAVRFVRDSHLVGEVFATSLVGLRTRTGALHRLSYPALWVIPDPDAHLMGQGDVEQEHSRFVSTVDAIVQAGFTVTRKDRLYVIAQRGRPSRTASRTASARKAIEQISVYAARASPIIAASPRLARTLPPPGLRGYTDLPDIYLSLLESLAADAVDRCGSCGKPIGLTPKQLAARGRGRKVYCSDACRIRAVEARPERKKKKALALKKLRRKRKLGRVEGLGTG
jgi:hypothetical protein